MSMLRDMMIEERERLNNVISVYENKLSQFVKGSIARKKINGKIYAYLNFRKKEKHFSKYIGPLESDEVKSIIEQINERKKYQDLLKRAKDNLKEVERFFRGEK